MNCWLCLHSYITNSTNRTAQSGTKLRHKNKTITNMYTSNWCYTR